MWICETGDSNQDDSASETRNASRGFGDYPEILDDAANYFYFYRDRLINGPGIVHNIVTTPISRCCHLYLNTSRLDFHFRLIAFGFYLRRLLLPTPTSRLNRCRFG